MEKCYFLSFNFVLINSSNIFLNLFIINLNRRIVCFKCQVFYLKCCIFIASLFFITLLKFETKNVPKFFETEAKSFISYFIWKFKKIWNTTLFLQTLFFIIIYFPAQLAICMQCSCHTLHSIWFLMHGKRWSRQSCDNIHTNIHVRYCHNFAKYHWFHPAHRSRSNSFPFGASPRNNEFTQMALPLKFIGTRLCRENRRMAVKNERNSRGCDFCINVWNAFGSYWLHWLFNQIYYTLNCSSSNYTDWTLTIQKCGGRMLQKLLRFWIVRNFNLKYKEIKIKQKCMLLGFGASR